MSFFFVFYKIALHLKLIRPDIPRIISQLHVQVAHELDSHNYNLFLFDFLLLEYWKKGNVTCGLKKNEKFEENLENNAYLYRGIT